MAARVVRGVSHSVARVRATTDRNVARPHTPAHPELREYPLMDPNPRISVSCCVRFSPAHAAAASLAGSATTAAAAVIASKIRFTMLKVGVISCAVCENEEYADGIQSRSWSRSPALFRTIDSKAIERARPSSLCMI